MKTSEAGAPVQCVRPLPLLQLPERAEPLPLVALLCKRNGETATHYSATPISLLFMLERHQKMRLFFLLNDFKENCLIAHHAKQTNFYCKISKQKHTTRAFIGSLFVFFSHAYKHFPNLHLLFFGRLSAEQAVSSVAVAVAILNSLESASRCPASWWLEKPLPLLYHSESP